MANKIIKIGKPEQNIRDPEMTETYSDISMDSKSIKNKSNFIYNKDYNEEFDFNIDKKVDLAAISNSLHNIFTWIPGERILLPSFGSTLYNYVYSGMTHTNINEIKTEIRKLISIWEQRISVVSVEDVSDIINSEENTVLINITYTINGLKDKTFTYLLEA